MTDLSSPPHIAEVLQEAGGYVATRRSQLRPGEAGSPALAPSSPFQGELNVQGWGPGGGLQRDALLSRHAHAVLLVWRSLPQLHKLGDGCLAGQGREGVLR